MLCNINGQNIYRLYSSDTYVLHFFFTISATLILYWFVQLCNITTIFYIFSSSAALIEYLHSIWLCNVTIIFTFYAVLQYYQFRKKLPCIKVELKGYQSSLRLSIKEVKRLCCIKVFNTI